MSSIDKIGKSLRDTRLIYQLISTEKKKKYFYEKMVIDILPTDNVYPLSTQTACLMDQIYDYLNDIYQTAWAIPPYFNDTAKIWQEIM